MQRNISYIVLFGVIILAFSYINVSALEIGDEMGNVLYTDIKTYIDGYRIPSYNIRNKSVVLIKDLVNYGFKSFYDDKTRTSNITDGGTFRPIPIEDFEIIYDSRFPWLFESAEPGTVAYKYVYTDIAAIVNCRMVESFNIKGNLAIFFEDIGNYGTFTWDSRMRESRFVSYKPVENILIYDTLINSGEYKEINIQDRINYEIYLETVDSYSQSSSTFKLEYDGQSRYALMPRVPESYEDALQYADYSYQDLNKINERLIESISFRTTRGTGGNNLIVAFDRDYPKEKIKQQFTIIVIINGEKLVIEPNESRRDINGSISACFSQYIDENNVPLGREIYIPVYTDAMSGNTGRLFGNPETDTKEFFASLNLLDIEIRRASDCSNAPVKMDFYIISHEENIVYTFNIDLDFEYEG